MSQYHRPATYKDGLVVLNHMRPEDKEEMKKLAVEGKDLVCERMGLLRDKNNYEVVESHSLFSNVRKIIPLNKRFAINA